MNKESEVKKIKVASIRINGGTQSRASINRETVAEYAEAMQAGDEFPPVIVFYDGADYWLADGFHRYEAYALAGAKDVPADVRQGTQREAILFSVGANAAHGLRRTNDDKRRAVMVLLNDPEWSKWSNREIARQCGVNDKTVAACRGEVTAEIRSEDRQYTTKHGTQTTMATANIGAKSKPDQEAPAQLAPPISDDEGECKAPDSKLDQEPDDAAEPEDPAVAKVRRELRKLTRDALEDEVIGLRADLADTKAKAKKQAEEIRVLKAHVKGFEGDQAETIRRQAKLLEHKSSEVFRANDKADNALAKARLLEKRVKELEAMGIEV